MCQNPEISGVSPTMKGAKIIPLLGSQSARAQKDSVTLGVMILSHRR